MKLSEVLSSQEFVELKKDGEFEELSLITVKTDRKTMSFIEDEKYIKYITENITCIFCSEDLYEYLPKNIGIVICKHPKVQFFKLHNNLINTKSGYCRTKFNTTIGKNCNISPRCSISSSNVIIGNNVTIEDFVVVKENVIIGNNSVIRAGSVIGGEGFEFKKIGSESILPVIHVGGVVIGNEVEIQQHCCIIKSVFPWDDTIIGDYTKLDNYVNVSHGCKIGKRCLIAVNSIIGGSSTIGDDCCLGMGVIISNNIRVGDKSKITLGSIIVNNVENGVTMATRPAFRLS